MTDRFSRTFTIEGREIGDGRPVYLIAEAGVAHFGSEEKALRLVDLAADAGADAVKFQVFDVDELISRELPEWRERLASRQLPYEAFARIQAYCRTRGITFFATAHDEKSLAFLTSLDVPVYKIGSGEVGNWPFLRRIGSLGKPVILSTGMYSDAQVADALKVMADAGCRDLAVLHCVTRYPVPPSEAHLADIARLRTHGAIVGYSDHTKGWHIPLAAVALGARVIEKHISLDFNVPNAQDWKVSCGPHDLAEAISQIREVEASLTASGSEMEEGERASAVWATKSLVAARDIATGETLSASDLVAKRPGTGIPPSAIDTVIGRRAAAALRKDTVITVEHLA